MSLHVIGPYEHSAPFPDREDKEKLIGQRGMCIWMTGLSGSGKTTIGNALARMLHEAGHLTQVLDGDIIRQGICRDLGFSEDDRAENIRRTAEVAKLMADSGLIVLVSLISPYRADRQHAREIVGEQRFQEVFVDTPLEICEQRDPKGLYQKARQGLIPNFTGIDSPYEAPESPELTVDTTSLPPEAAADTIIDYLRENGFID